MEFELSEIWVVLMWVVGIWTVQIWVVRIWIIEFELSEFKLSEFELSCTLSFLNYVKLLTLRSFDITWSYKYISFKSSDLVDL